MRLRATDRKHVDRDQPPPRAPSSRARAREAHTPANLWGEKCGTRAYGGLDGFRDDGALRPGEGHPFKRSPACLLEPSVHLLFAVDITPDVGEELSCHQRRRKRLRVPRVCPPIDDK